MVKAESLEFGFVEQMPKRAKSRWQTVWEHFQDLRRITDEKGMLVPLNLAASIGGVSRQRMVDLANAQTVERVEVDGHPFITESSLVKWAKSERKPGRPFNKLPESKSEAFRAAMGYAKSELSSRRKKKASEKMQ